VCSSDLRFYDEDRLDQNNNEKNMDLNYSIGALCIEQGRFSESRRYILIAKNLGSREAENLWYKHELYKY